MIHHSLPGERGFAVLQEAVYQNSTYRKSDRKPVSVVKSHNHNNNNNNHNNHNHHNSMKMKPTAYTLSPATGHFYMNAAEHGDETEQNIPPVPDVPPPLPPKRTTSLLGTTPRPKTAQRDAVTMNPKRISIATSTFWDGHPDLGHFVSGWELGRDRSESGSVWGTTDRGGSESVNIWGDPPAVKKGILLQHRDKLLARWKERYCILTRDYLHCFRRSTSIHRSGVRLSEMGTFMFKLRLADVETIEWETRKSGPIIAILLPQESRLLLRTLSDTYEALEQWYTLLQECIYMSKERRRALRNHHIPNHISAMTTLQSHMSTLSKASTSEGSSGGGAHNSSSAEVSPNSSTKSKSTSKSSQSSHSSSDIKGSSSSSMSSSSNHDLQRFQQQQQLQQSHNSKSFAKSNLGRMSLKLTPSNSKIDNVHQKYAPLLDHHGLEEEEDEYDEAQDQFYHEVNIPLQISAKKSSRASIAVVEGRSERPPSAGMATGPSMTLHDFVKNPWKSGGTYSRGTIISSGYSIPRDAVRSSINNGNHNSSNHTHNHNHNHSSQSTRPESWNTQQFYKTPVLTGNGAAWGKSSPPGGGTFSKGRDSIYSTSRHTSEITFRKMS